MRDEITPKNILMIGPTGVGKTEIARRLAALVGAPFVKVEATKYTEVGYVGRDVESMVRDLVDASIRTVTDERREEVRDLAARHAVERVIDDLHPETRPPSPQGQGNPFGAALGSIFGSGFAAGSSRNPVRPQRSRRDAQRVREQTRGEIERGFYDVRLIEIEVEETPSLPIGVIGGGLDQGGDIGEMLGGILPKRRTKKRVTVAEALRIFEQEEAAKLIDMDAVKREALRRAGEDGIIFIDEIDKVAGSQQQRGGPDVSREGVQRDILPIVEGSTVNTKHGPIKTDHILFIAAGAFHISKPSDLIPELQGRLPIRVELDSLTAEDFKTILTQPKNALVEQYKALLATDGVTLEFHAGRDRRSSPTFAMTVNEQTENIGARRLHTVLERVLEDVSFDAPETHRPGRDRRFVRPRAARRRRGERRSLGVHSLRRIHIRSGRAPDAEQRMFYTMKKSIGALSRLVRCGQRACGLQRQQRYRSRPRSDVDTERELRWPAQPARGALIQYPVRTRLPIDSRNYLRFHQRRVAAEQQLQFLLVAVQRNFDLYRPVRHRSARRRYRRRTRTPSYPNPTYYASAIAGPYGSTYIIGPQSGGQPALERRRQELHPASSGCLVPNTK